MDCKNEDGPAVISPYVVKTKSSGMRNLLSLQTTTAAHFVKKMKNTSYYFIKRTITPKRGFISHIKEWDCIQPNRYQESGLL